MVKFTAFFSSFICSAPRAESTAPSVLPEDADDDSPHPHVLFVHVDRLHRAVGGLQADGASALPVELLEGGVLAAEERDHHLAVARGLAVLDDDVVAVADLLLDHGVALDLKDVCAPPAEHVLGDE